MGIINKIFNNIFELLILLPINEGLIKIKNNLYNELNNNEEEYRINNKL